ncbi:right-handed parallel beta-helix repeat-containing protein [Pedobacter sp. P351]|uniref:pectate lyase family protein n=1 Tax=Pedobacter superstes TaxID=3133441 RepID=UPI0030AA6511
MKEMKRFSFNKGLSMCLLLCAVILFTQCKKESTDEVYSDTTTSAIMATTSATTVSGSLDVSKAASDGGFAYVINQNLNTTGDSPSQPTVSTIRIFEDGKEIGPAHSVHNDVRTSGQGRFSHWGTKIYFSASDNTNPKTNGRKYTYTNATATVALSTTPLDVSSSVSDGGFAYAVVKDFGITSDSDTQPTISTLRVFENGVELNPAHSVHADIRNYGNGRYSHWAGKLYFSASDNSNPRTNGRQYSYIIGEAATTTTPPPTTTAPPQEITPPATETAQPATGIVGYANVNGLTTGGQGGQTVTVSTLSALKSAAASSSPMIIQFSGNITGTGYVNISSNKTIIGLSGSSMDGVGLLVYGTSNVIIRNMTIRNVVTYSNIVIKENAHHVWVDHCTLSSDRSHGWDYYDGLLDVGNGSDYVSLSWNKLHDNHIALLIGFSDARTSDIGKLHVTVYNNYFYNVSERQPTTRFGQMHVFNNYVKNGSGYGIGVTMDATVRTDNNYFEGTGVPIRTDFNAKPGYVSGANTNIFNGGTPRITTAASNWVPSYEYQSVLIPAANVPSVVASGAGAK